MRFIEIHFLFRQIAAIVNGCRGGGGIFRSVPRLSPALSKVTRVAKSQEVSLISGGQKIKKSSFSSADQAVVLLNSGGGKLTAAAIKTIQNSFKIGKKTKLGLGIAAGALVTGFITSEIAEDVENIVTFLVLKDMLHAKNYTREEILGYMEEHEIDGKLVHLQEVILVEPMTDIRTRYFFALMLELFDNRTQDFNFTTDEEKLSYLYSTSNITKDMVDSYKAGEIMAICKDESFEDKTKRMIMQYFGDDMIIKKFVEIFPIHQEILSFLDQVIIDGFSSAADYDEDEYIELTIVDGNEVWKIDSSIQRNKIIISTQLEQKPSRILIYRADVNDEHDQLKRLIVIDVLSYGYVLRPRV